MDHKDNKNFFHSVYGVCVYVMCSCVECVCHMHMYVSARVYDVFMCVVYVFVVHECI